MSSSISSSDRPRPWADWLVWYFAVLAGSAAALYLFVLIMDPFSTGLFSPFKSVDIAFSGHAESNAGRVRDSAYDSAIFGNSVATAIQPDLLDGPGSRRFVLLALPGLGPNNQLTIARAFVRSHGTQARTLVFMLEPFWCTTDERSMYRYPHFPDWLYDLDRWRYLKNILSLDAAQAAFHRLAIRLAHAREPSRRDGFVPPHRPWTPWRPAALPSRPEDAPPQPWKFIALERLQEFRRTIPANIGTVLYFVPFHVSLLPKPGSQAEVFLQACKAQAHAIASEGPRTIIIDRLRDDDTARDLNNFYDGKHVLDHVVRTMEVEIVEAIRGMD